MTPTHILHSRRGRILPEPLIKHKNRYGPLDSSVYKNEYVKALKYLLFVSNQVTKFFFLFGLSPVVNKFDIKRNLMKPFTGKYCLINLKNCKETLKN